MPVWRSMNCLIVDGLQGPWVGLVHKMASVLWPSDQGWFLAKQFHCIQALVLCRALSMKKSGTKLKRKLRCFGNCLGRHMKSDPSSPDRRSYFGDQHFWSSLVLEELCRLGVQDVCVAPGSRSTPLVMALEDLRQRFDLNVHTHIDERGLGFLALGLTKSTGKPTVILTTSGTAVANLLPAVIEASQTYAPLIVISADPVQVNRSGCQSSHCTAWAFFGEYVRHSVSSSVPDGECDVVRCLQMVDQLWACAAHPTQSGPVHLNAPFKEPLVAPERHCYDGVLQQVSDWRSSTEAYSIPEAISAQHNRLMKYELAPEVLSVLEDAVSGVVVLGALHDLGDILDMAEQLIAFGWPIIADPLSGCIGMNGYPFLGYADFYLDSLISADIVPDVVLHLGGPVVSKRVQKFMASRTGSVIHVSELEWVVDPDGAVTHRVVAQPRVFISRCLRAEDPSSRWLDARLPSMDWVDKEVSNVLNTMSHCSELAVVRQLTQHLPESHLFFVGNSTPIRDVLWAGARHNRPVQLLGNRGASGIDGLVATAAGAAKGANAPLTLLIGDMSVLYDVSSWVCLRTLNTTVVVVIINNGGGKIFDVLPISDMHPNVLPTYYYMDQSVSFSKLAEAFGFGYQECRSVAAFVNAYDQVVAGNGAGIMVLDVVTTSLKEDVRRLEVGLTQ